MYKAIFEISPTRSDFVSHLFSIKPVEKAPVTARPNGLFLAFDGVKGDKAYYIANLAAIRNNLAKHGFALSKDDLQKIEYIYDVFFRAGPEIDYMFASPYPAGMAPAPNYIQAMTDTDADKKQWSFLASEENYRFVRDLQMKNLVIPIVGDFSGPSAVRKVADYIRQRNGNVSAFYISNVEYYLGGPGTREQAPTGEASLQRFYQNAATLPVDSSSMFIRFIGAVQSSNLQWWNGAWLQAVSPMIDLRDRIKVGGAPTYAQALQMVPDPKTLMR
jgi:hypothetical protein